MAITVSDLQFYQSERMTDKEVITMTNNLSSRLDVTLNAICAMISSPLEIAHLDFSSDESLIDDLQRFCINKQAHFDDSDCLELHDFLETHPECVPNWHVLAIVAKQMKSVPPATLEVMSDAE